MELFSELWPIAVAFGLLWLVTDGLVIWERNYGSIKSGFIRTYRRWKR